ncbi:MAG TPA: methyltransferase domain-containing protein [Gammaproteobacteria bacterium]|nr:methyltransferase domain-containing protein [Gammaproteobacteria bacterium]
MLTGPARRVKYCGQVRVRGKIAVEMKRNPTSEGALLRREQALREWCRRPLGRALLQAERAVLDEILCNVFGYHLVVVEPGCDPGALDASRIMHQVVQTASPVGLERTAGVIGLPERLPYLSDSIDALLLPHTLELAEDPHGVLREAERCLVPEGHLIVLGFNPWGLWGLRRLFGLRGRRTPWSLRFIGQARLRDWLSLLGFDTVHARYLFPHPPWSWGLGSERRGLLHRLHRPHWPLLAASYVLVARKRVATLTPIKPRWRPRRAILAGGVVESRDGGLPGHG